MCSEGLSQTIEGGLMNVHLIRIKLKSLQVFKNILCFNHANTYLWFLLYLALWEGLLSPFILGWY